MCIWNRQNGELVRDFQFISPTLFSKVRKNTSYESGDLNATTDQTLNSMTATIFNSIETKLLNFMSSRFLFANSSNNSRQVLGSSEQIIMPPPTMCLYSRNILITGGCSCIFLWNIRKGELIKKININKMRRPSMRMEENLENYSLSNQIKQVKMIRQLDKSMKYLNTNRTKFNKLIIVTDFTDSIYVLRIPSNLIQNFD